MNILHITTIRLRVFAVGKTNSQQSCCWLGLKVSAMKVSPNGHLFQPVSNFHGAKKLKHTKITSKQ